MSDDTRKATTISTRFFAMYKCRSCGEIIIDENSGVENINSAIEALGAEKHAICTYQLASCCFGETPTIYADSNSAILERLAVHICRNGNIGLADLVGMKFVEGTN